MILYPAIDLKDGQCVRLLRGEMDKATVFSESPATQAAAFEKAGFDYERPKGKNHCVMRRTVPAG